mmetsp:Transcript_57520/g.136845  ORF Transcript_57520/g.136845 Transcript_57520/m.136845 type:complete len:150 (+) Transcript_57520:68-517(+)
MGCASSDATATATTRYQDKSPEENGSSQATSSKSYRSSPPAAGKQNGTSAADPQSNGSKPAKATVKQTSPEPAAAATASRADDQPVLREWSPDDTLRPPSQPAELYCDRDGDIAHEFWEEEAASGKLRKVAPEELQRVHGKSMPNGRAA